MDSSSIITKTWILCSTMSLLGFLILLLCLNHQRHGTSVATFMSVKFSDLVLKASTREKLFNTSVDIAEVVDEKGRKDVGERTPAKCDLFDGRWVFEPKGSPLYHAFQCPFLSDQVSCRRNGRPDLDYENWKWEANQCDIPRFNGLELLERWRGKRVVVVGDSLNRNQWESLACLLYSVIPPSRANVSVQNSGHKVFLAKDYNCTVEFFWSPFLVQLEETEPKALKLGSLSSTAPKWRGAHIMIFNTGHWWTHHGKLKAWDFFEYEGKLLRDLTMEKAYERAMRTWAQWIDRNVDPSLTTVFFRSISPEHKTQKFWCYNQSQPLLNTSYEETFPSSLVGILERTIRGMRTPVQYLNITRLSKYRIEAHASVYTSKQGNLLTVEQRKQPNLYADCSHWCLPGLPDTWNTLIYALIGLGISSQTS